MPTPFTHLAAAQRLLDDDQVPAGMRAFARQQAGPFLLGHIAADARVSSGVTRSSTHFYAYDKPVDVLPWRRMLADYPALRQPDSPAQVAFVAAYVAHLAMDTVWTVEMVHPHFALSQWARQSQRFLMLNALLICMDRRDYAALESWQRPALAAADPNAWVPFIPDNDLRGWRDFVATQLPPDGCSQTLAVIGARVNRTPDELETLLAPDSLQLELWPHVPPETVAAAEARMVARARDEMVTYLQQAGVSS